MKRLMMILLTLGLTLNIFAASESSIRSRALFLTDKMAYELRLNSSQISDVYEINYDFFNAVGDLVDNAMVGESWALDEYYDALDIRNDDMRYVLSAVQYNRFLNCNYFSRPIYQTSRTWKLRIYYRYPNINKYYYGKPRCYSSYYGEHYRSSFSYSSYYNGRYSNISHSNTSFRKNNQGYYNNRYARDFNNGGYRVKAKKGYESDNKSTRNQYRSGNTYNNTNNNTGNRYNNSNRNNNVNSNTGGTRNTYNRGNTYNTRSNNNAYKRSNGNTTTRNTLDATKNKPSRTTDLNKSNTNNNKNNDAPSHRSRR